MSLPYFPFYSDRFEAKTAHLSMLEDGAYNRLLRLCWRTPGCKLPNDTAWIFRQLRAVTKDDKAAVEAVLSEFFTKGRGKIWNERLLEVYGQVSVAHQNKSEAGKKGVAAKALKINKNTSSTAKAQLKQPLSNQNQTKNQIEEGGDGSAGAGERDFPQPETFRESILAECGVDPISGMTGHGGRQIGTQADMAEAHRWLELPNISEAVALTEIRRVMTAKRDGPPKSFGYFTDAIRRLSGSLSAPSLTPADPTQPTPAATTETGQEFVLRLMRQVGLNPDTETMQ